MEPQPIGMRIIMQRARRGEFNLVILSWIANNWGSLLVLNFDGRELSITSPPEDSSDPIMTLR